MTKFILLACAGALGTLARYGLARFAQRIGGDVFPWGTFSVNMIGCLAFGLFISLSEERFNFSQDTRIIVIFGFMGAFTTFSSLAFDTTNLIQQNQLGLAAANVLAQNILGVLGLMLGLVAGKLLCN
jgi:CrcB protein